MDGYKEAEKIEELIQKIAREHPISHENAVEWLHFTRTLSTSLEIFKAKAFGILKRKSSSPNQLY
jgi:cell division FtsZ-interacting protein ZapD